MKNIREIDSDGSLAAADAPRLTSIDERRETGRRDRRRPGLRKILERALDRISRPATRRRGAAARSSSVCADISRGLYDHLVNVRIREIDGPLYATARGPRTHTRQHARYRATPNGSSRAKYPAGIERYCVARARVPDFKRTSKGIAIYTKSGYKSSPCTCCNFRQSLQRLLCDVLSQL